jgi:SAM-dependent MidA family methyltransferase
MTTLPTPDPTAQSFSEKLTQLIREEIISEGRPITFARFMELALYAPGLGYYSAGMHKLGREGDFVTAPEISPLFAKCVAKQCSQILTELDHGDILEFGAGSGIFAKDLLLELEKLDALPTHYFILEVSPDLRQRQLELFKTRCPHLLSRIAWLDRLPEQPINGIIFANEVLDAMPVHCFTVLQNEIKERCVDWENNQFVWRLSSGSPELHHYLKTILPAFSLDSGYQSEASLIQPAWIATMAQALNKGLLLLIDYGYGRAEYYHPERRDGTLMCFYRHHKLTNPLTLVGLQDITAHVDFTLLAESAVNAGLNVSGFTTQAAFLLATGLLEIANEQSLPEIETFKQNQQIKMLTLPSQMGEVVKVLGLTKNINISLLGFSLQDRRKNL